MIFALFISKSTGIEASYWSGLVGGADQDFVDGELAGTFEGESDDLGELVSVTPTPVRTQSRMRFEREEMQTRRETRAIELPHSWTPEELASIEDDIMAERPRGTTPRFWEDVEGGVELDANTKGPIGLSDEIAFVASGAAPIPPTLLNRSIPCTTTITRHACRALKRSWATSRLPV